MLVDMKNYINIFILIVLCFGLTSVKPNDDLNVNWGRITDKDYVVKYVQIVYDTTTDEAIRSKAYSIDVDKNAKTLTKNNVKQLQKFISDSNNFGDEIEDPECGMTKFTNAFVVLRRDDMIGIIRLSCNGNYWVFEPKTKDIISVLVSEDGMKAKERIFSELK